MTTQVTAAPTAPPTTSPRAASNCGKQAFGTTSFVVCVVGVSGIILGEMFAAPIGQWIGVVVIVWFWARSRELRKDSDEERHAHLVERENDRQERSRITRLLKKQQGDYDRLLETFKEKDQIEEHSSH